MWTLPTVSDDDLHLVERDILTAFRARSTHGLKILGMGELGLAVGWPSNEPVAVFKRQAPGTSGEVAADLDRMRRFHDALIRAGIAVVPTDIRVITNEYGASVPYLIQPIIEPGNLTENLLAARQPDSADEILVAIRDAVTTVVRDGSNGGLSIDAQVTNFAWDRDKVVLLDTTPPLIWDPGSGPMYDVGNYLTAVPSILRPTAMTLTKRTAADYRNVRGVLKQTVVYLLRIDQERWVQPAIECFNDVLDVPLVRDEVEESFKRVLRDIPMIKRLSRMQRFWATRVRKENYEFFITNSFTGEIY